MILLLQVKFFYVLLAGFDVRTSSLLWTISYGDKSAVKIVSWSTLLECLLGSSNVKLKHMLHTQFWTCFKENSVGIQCILLFCDTAIRLWNINNFVMSDSTIDLYKNVQRPSCESIHFTLRYHAWVISSYIIILCITHFFKSWRRPNV